MDRHAVNALGPADRSLLGVAIMLAVALSVGCGDPDTQEQGSADAGHAPSSASLASRASSASGLASSVEASGAASPTRSPAADVAEAESSWFAGATAPSGSPSRAVALSQEEPATVEELLAEGLHRAGASPVHLAIHGTPAATSVRLARRSTERGPA